MKKYTQHISCSCNGNIEAAVILVGVPKWEKRQTLGVEPKQDTYDSESLEPSKKKRKKKRAAIQINDYLHNRQMQCLALQNWL